jgi:putative transposase
MRFTAEQVKDILREARSRQVKDVCREHGISEQTFYRWKARHARGEPIDPARLVKRLEEENRRLKEIVADLALDNQALRAALGPNGVGRARTKL